MKIHPTAIIGDKVQFDESVVIGPHVVIDGEVTIEKNVKIFAGACITGYTHIGEGTEIHMNAVIGHLPQDISFDRTQKSYVKIGKNNIFRESSQIHRSKFEGKSTIVGDNNYFMACTHIAHDCKLGNNIVIVNNSLVAGHVEIDDNVFISGNAAIHQWVRLGKLSFIRGITAVGKDVPPFMTVGNVSEVIGYNLVGIRRANYTHEECRAIRHTYDVLYRKGNSIQKAIEELEQHSAPIVQSIVTFIKNSSRGVCVAGTNRHDRQKIMSFHKESNN